MSRALKSYPKYKETGIELLARLPEHWDLVPNRSIFKIRKRVVGAKSNDFTLLSLSINGVIPRNLEDPEGKFPADFSTYQVVEPGNLVFCLFDMDETPRTVGIASSLGMVTGAYTVLESDNPDITRFLYLFYLAMDNQKCLRPFYTGLRKVITKSAFMSMKVPVPPQPDRSAIIRFASNASEHIKSHIAAKKKLAALLSEQRRVIIDQAVRLGLSAGVETSKLGSSPEFSVNANWDVLPLYRLARIRDEKDRTDRRCFQCFLARE